MNTEEYKIIQRRNYLYEVGGVAFEWLLELAEQQKHSGDFPVFLSDFYKEPSDKEICVLLECLIPHLLDIDVEYSEIRHNAIVEMHEILGASPSEYVKNRAFVDFAINSEGSVFDRRSGLRKEDFVCLLDWLWEINSRGDNVEQIWNASLSKKCDTQSLWPDTLSIPPSYANTTFAIMRLATKDGFGLGLWNTFNGQFPYCPGNAYIYNVTSSFYPIEPINTENFDEILRFMGFEHTTDYIYAVIGINKYRYIDPTIMGRFRNLFKRIFVQGSVSRMALPTVKNKKDILKTLPDIGLKVKKNGEVERTSPQS